MNVCSTVLTELDGHWWQGWQVNLAFLSAGTKAGCSAKIGERGGARFGGPGQKARDLGVKNVLI